MMALTRQEKEKLVLELYSFIDQNTTLLHSRLKQVVACLLLSYFFDAPLHM